MEILGSLFSQVKRVVTGLMRALKEGQVVGERDGV